MTKRGNLNEIISSKTKFSWIILTIVTSEVSVGKLLLLWDVWFKMQSHLSTAVINMEKFILKSADDH